MNAQLEQRRQALVVANQRRAERKRVLGLVASGELDWRLLILDPPECVSELLVSELLLMLPWMGRRRVERLGLLACEFGVSLTVRTGSTSAATRQWVVRHALPRRQVRS